MANLTPEPIFQVANGFMAAKYLFIANEVGLFKTLGEEPATLGELAQRIGIPRRTTRIVADAMVALGFVERQGDHYQNGSVADTFLSGRTLTDLCQFLRYLNRLNYPMWMRLEEAVRTGRALFGEFRFTEEEQRLFTEGVESLTAGQARALAANYDFTRHRSVLDLGGGTGLFLIAVMSQYIDLKGTLFELPGAAAIARQRLVGSPLAGRIQIDEGDFFKASIPGGHDAVIVANVIHLFSPERNLELLHRIRESSRDGSRLLLVDFWTDSTHTEPLFAALMAGAFLLRSGEGDVYSQEEVHGWLQATGWRPLERKTLAGPASVIVAEAAVATAAPRG
ncbi:MAG TPA: methyltransferase [Candidatus Binatia bacterium]|nr:methyltransferase [Candidatus Binatia bacterium]